LFKGRHAIPKCAEFFIHNGREAEHSDTQLRRQRTLVRKLKRSDSDTSTALARLGENRSRVEPAAGKYGTGCGPNSRPMSEREQHRVVRL
jgi:hypothetical protein